MDLNIPQQVLVDMAYGGVTGLTMAVFSLIGFPAITRPAYDTFKAKVGKKRALLQLVGWCLLIAVNGVAIGGIVSAYNLGQPVMKVTIGLLITPSVLLAGVVAIEYILSRRHGTPFKPWAAIGFIAWFLLPLGLVSLLPHI